MSWKYDTSNFEPVTKIERQACANKAHKHRGRGGWEGVRTWATELASSFHISLQYTTHTHKSLGTLTKAHTQEQIKADKHIKPLYVTTHFTPKCADSFTHTHAQINHTTQSTPVKS